MCSDCPSCLDKAMPRFSHRSFHGNTIKLDVMRLIAFCVATTCACVTHAAITLGTPFRDGAVLQRGKPIRVWGTAGAGENLRVELHGESAQTNADAQGHWQATLAPLPAISAAQELTVTGTRDRVTIHNIVLGDVWLCSGQSNMYFPVRSGLNGQEEIRAAQDSLLREFAPKAVAPKS